METIKYTLTMTPISLLYKILIEKCIGPNSRITIYFHTGYTRKKTVGNNIPDYLPTSRSRAFFRHNPMSIIRFVHKLHGNDRTIALQTHIV